MKIPYVDAHCDTIYRCEETGCGGALEMKSDREAQEAYYDACGCLRENGGHIDLLRGREFARYGQFFALYWDAKNAPADGMPAQCQRLHDRFLREMEENSDCITHCRTGAEVDEAVRQGKIAALLSIEGADLLDCEERNLEMAHAWGVRLLNPVWNRANSLCGTNCEDPDRGLSEKGKNFLRRMEALNIYPDMSHISDAGFWDTVKTTRGPVVASHSNARALCPHRRNLTDDQFRAIRDSGGVVGINLYNVFVGGDRMEDLLAHFDHFLELGGEKTLALGSDWDGDIVGAGGIRGVEEMHLLAEAMARRGYGEKLIRSIFYDNLARLLGLLPSA